LACGCVSAFAGIPARRRFASSLLAISEADELTSVEGTLTVNSTPAAPGGTYRSVTDEADLWYADASGQLVQVTLPAPDSSIFLSDQETVDPANAGIVTLNGQVIGLVLTAAGGVVTNFVGGIRSKRTGGT